MFQLFFCRYQEQETPPKRLKATGDISWFTSNIGIGCCRINSDFFHTALNCEY